MTEKTATTRTTSSLTAKLRKLDSNGSFVHTLHTAEIRHFPDDDTTGAG